MSFFAAQSVHGAVVVAHPDDETLWCGGLLARYPGLWTVICCSIPRTDPVRSAKFFNACRVFNARGILLPSIETEPDQPLNNLAWLELDDYDLIVTHNAAGEYGHKHHQQVHEYVKSRWRGKTATIGFGKGRAGAEKLVLDDNEYARKMAALKKYNHILPYRGSDIPKWEALLHRYGTVEGVDFRTETYDCPAL